MEQPQLEKPRGDRVEASTHAKTSSRGNFEPSGQREHMHPYLQLGCWVMWSDSPKKVGIRARSLRYPTSLIRPCYGSPNKE